MGAREIKVSFLKLSFCNFSLKEGFLASADQFYLNRPVKDVLRLLEIAKTYVTIQPNDTIFEPGCGAGRHLQFLADKYRCNVVGLDIHSPAIEVAHAADVFNGSIFEKGSCLNQDVLHEIFPSNCKITLMNSFLNHVHGFSGFDDMIDYVIHNSSFVLVINNAKFDLRNYFPTAEIIFEKSKTQLVTPLFVVRGSWFISDEKSPSYWAFGNMVKKYVLQ